MDALLLDVRQSLRALVRTPILTSTIVLTVGLGLGATTAMFAVIHAVLIEPLPYADPERLVRIYTDAPPNRFHFSVADYLALERQQTKFDRVAGYTIATMAFTQGDVAERINARIVSWGYFSLLGITPLRGRTFVQGDGVPGGPRSVVVTEGFAQRHLGGDTEAIGKTISLDGLDYTIVGVLPRAVGPLETRSEVFTAAQWDTPPRRGPFLIVALGRLRKHTSRALATEELRAINRAIFPLWQSSYQDTKATWSAMDLKAFVLRDVGPTLTMVLGAVAFVLLIASANAANLLVARITRRRRELAVRSALGASRGRLVQHLLSESALLAVGGAMVGLGVAVAGIDLLRTAGAQFIPRSAEIGFTGPVLLFLAATTAGAALLFGLVPSLHGTTSTQGMSSGRSTDAVGPRLMRRALVVLEFAVATPLLAAAGLLLVSLVRLQRVEVGIDRHNVLTGAIQLPREQYPDSSRIARFWDELKAKAEAVPGVQAVAFTDSRPPADAQNVNNFDLEDDPTLPGKSQPTSIWVSVTPEYFGLMGISAMRGRVFDRHDGEGDPVVIVDRSWANRFFPGRDPVGRRLHEGGCMDCPVTTIIGVVSDVKYGGLDQPNQGTVYWPMAGRPSDVAFDRISSRFRYVVLRTSGDPNATIPSIRRVVRDLDPGLPLFQVATVDELMDNSLEMPRYLSLLVGAFAVVALLLSTIGIYGVMAYFVEQHVKEIGIRIAIGGAPGMVSRMVVGQGMRVVGAGVAIGVAGALVLTRFLSSLLYEIGPTDARVFLTVSLLMVVVALAGCAVPALRAAGVDPSVALREE
ncbi:MAG TPA: ABC transporter permease [Gemmatimonadales bacterium]|jgi:putative ABC transport system permease protein